MLDEDQTVERTLTIRHKAGLRFFDAADRRAAFLRYPHNGPWRVLLLTPEGECWAECRPGEGAVLRICEGPLFDVGPSRETLWHRLWGVFA